MAMSALGSPVTAMNMRVCRIAVTRASCTNLVWAFSPGSELVVVPEATHEALTYYFKDLTPVVVPWLEGEGQRK